MEPVFKMVFFLVCLSLMLHCLVKRKEDLRFHKFYKNLDDDRSIYTQGAMHHRKLCRIIANSQIILLQIEILIKAIVNRINDVIRSKGLTV